MSFKEILAKAIRILSIPPIMVSLLIVILINQRPEIFGSTVEVIITFLLLGVIPILAYPFQRLIPALRNSGRKGQRTMAFIFSFIGYTVATIWSISCKGSQELQLICMTYFFSLMILIFFNKVLEKRASGHACSVTGPLIFLVYFVNWKLIFPCLIIAAIIFWSSLFLKRHTKQDLFNGTASCLIGFIMTYLLIY